MQKYIYNFNWLLLERVIRIVGGLFVTVWVSRYLGPDGFGLFCYASAFIAFFSWASHLGLNDIVVRELSTSPDNTSRILGAAFGLKLAGAVLSIVLVLAAILLISPSGENVKVAVGIAALVYVFRSFDVIDFYYKSRVLSKYTAMARTAAYISILGLQVFLILFEYGVLYFVAVTVIEALLAAIFLLYLYKKTGNSIIQWVLDQSMVKKLLKYSWPLMISIFLVSVHMKIDQVMIGSLLSMKDVGHYGIAVKLSEFWYFIPSIIVSTLMPYFIALREKNEELYRFRLIQLLSFMLWLGVFVGVVTYFVGEEIIVFLFGAEYKAAFDALLYNIWGGIFIAQGLACGIWMVAENRQLYRLYVQIFAVCANVSLNLMLIPVLGISGAALSTLLTYLLATWVFGFFFSELRAVTVMMIKSSSPYYIYRFAREKLLG